MTDNTHDDIPPAAQAEQLKILGAALGIYSGGSTEIVPSEVFELVRAGERMKAIRVLRKDVGMSLLAAKRAVDWMAVRPLNHKG